MWCEKRTHLVSGVGHVGFGTFVGAVRVGQLHVEQVEHEAVEGGTQTVTQAPDPSDHPLDDTWREAGRASVRSMNL